MKKESKLSGLPTMMALLAFALCTLLVLLMGVRVYQRLLDAGESAFTRRTAMGYIFTRIHQAENAVLENFDGCATLVLPEEIEGAHYRTLVYWYDGYLRELYCAADAKLHPQDSERILKTPEIFFEMENTLLAVHMEGNCAYLRLPAGKEVRR